MIHFLQIITSKWSQGQNGGNWRRRHSLQSMALRCEVVLRAVETVLLSFHSWQGVEG